MKMEDNNKQLWCQEYETPSLVELALGPVVVSGTTTPDDGFGDENNTSKTTTDGEDFAE